MRLTPMPAAASKAASVAAALPDVWCADQLASYRTAWVPTGYELLDRELPDGGWPSRTLIELLLQQPGIGEMRLLLPALRCLGERRIALVQPPHLPQAAAWVGEDVSLSNLLWVKIRRSADALWAAEQILRNGTCGALVLWQTHIRHESLRRLHLAAQSTGMLLWVVRPIAAADDASPAPLRLALRPAAGNIRIDIVKRRGPRRDDPLLLPLEHKHTAFFPVTESDYALVDQRTPAVAAAGNVSSELV